jgi:uncharacterized membrane protein
MKTIAQFVRTTILGGVFFLAPIVVPIVILAKAFDYAKKGLNAVLVHIRAASDLGAGAATALAVAVVALVFLPGSSLARWLRSASSTQWSSRCCQRFPPTTI